jgi:hypothetical protein
MLKADPATQLQASISNSRASLTSKVLANVNPFSDVSSLFQPVQFLASDTTSHLARNSGPHNQTTKAKVKVFKQCVQLLFVAIDPTTGDDADEATTRSIIDKIEIEKQDG